MQDDPETEYIVDHSAYGAKVANCVLIEHEKVHSVAAQDWQLLPWRGWGCPQMKAKWCAI